MTYIAQGKITLHKVSDAYTVSLTNPSCTIKADFDGSNPRLTEASTTISVTRGNVPVLFKYNVSKRSNKEITYIGSTSETGYHEQAVIQYQSIPQSDLDGYLMIDVITEDGYKASVKFPYVVVRESTMLDWIRDIETNKTTIGGSYVITPKIFAGTYLKGKPNGVYIGPSDLITSSPGIFGYKGGDIIFSLNEDGGKIGGWDIDNEGIKSKDKKLQILSDGTIKSVGNGGDSWVLNSDGSGQLASGSLSWDTDGNVTVSDDVVISWENISDAVGKRLTKIDKDGIYTGKIDAQQISAGAFSQKWKKLDSNYDVREVEKLIENQTNYYFILPKGDIVLPKLDEHSNIPDGTSITFLLPQSESKEIRSIHGDVVKSDFDKIDYATTLLPDGQIKYTIPIYSGLFIFQIGTMDNKKVWMFINYNEFQIEQYKKDWDKAQKEMKPWIKDGWWYIGDNPTGIKARADVFDFNIIEINGSSVMHNKQGNVTYKAILSYNGRDITAHAMGHGLKLQWEIQNATGKNRNGLSDDDWFTKHSHELTNIDTLHLTHEDFDEECRTKVKCKVVNPKILEEIVNTL